jgi:capsule polysaccharide export protein KpsE/RkpR
MEFIISEKVLKENQMRMRKMELARINKRKEAYRRKRLFYSIVVVIIFIFLFISAIQIFTSEPVTTKTPAGEYTCQGGLIKTCSGSRAVMDYLGV